MIRRTFLAMTAAAALATTASAQDMDIVDTAAAAGNFNTLLAAATAAGLVDTLKSEGPFTVFAPTDAAFADLADGVVDALLLEENHDKLREILLLHVVPGSYSSAELNGDLAILSLSEQPLVFERGTGPAMTGEATIAGSDIQASNGIIHSIGHVMLPKQPMETYRGIEIVRRVQ